MAARLMGSSTARFFHEPVLVKEPQTESRTTGTHGMYRGAADNRCNVQVIPAHRTRAEASLPGGVVLAGIGVRFAVIACGIGRLPSPAQEHVLERVPERREQQGQQEPGPAQCDRDRACPKAGTDIGMRGLCEGQRQHRDAATRSQRRRAKRPRSSAHKFHSG